MSRIISEDMARQRLSDKHGDTIKLITYTSMSEKSLFECTTCNHQWWADTRAVTRGNKCPNCNFKKAHDRYVYTFEYVKEQIEKELGYVLLSTKYIKANEKLSIKCPKDHIFDKSWNGWQSGQRCPICSKINFATAKITPVENILELLIEDELEFISFPEGYFGTKSKISYKCKENHVHTRIIRDYIDKRGCITCNLKRFADSQKGSNGSGWKGGKTSLLENMKHHITDWKKESMANCNYKCVITGKRFDDIHHLHGFNLILQEAMDELQLNYKENISNYTNEELTLITQKVQELHRKYPLGVCLSKEVHVLFHTHYGSGDNTIEQWNDFITKINNKTITIDN